MHLDDRDSLRISVAREIEPVVTRLFEEEIRRGQTVLDIGANIGYFTLLLARGVGPGGRVYAFEPDTTNFELLRRNVALNGYANVVPVPRAVWHETTTLRLYLSEDNAGDHRVFDSGEERRAISIEAVSIDDYFGPSPPEVHAIKMDIQGAEQHALDGMSRLLAKNRQLLFVTEFWPAALQRAGTSPRAFLEKLAALGFVPSLVEDRPERLAPTTIDALLERFTPENGDSADLVWRRG